MKRVAWITVGRLKYLEVQYPYLVQCLNEVDEVVYCIQRCGTAERQFVEKAARDHPGKIRVIEVEKPHSDSASVSNILRRVMNEPDTLYIKLDDDIVFIEPGTFRFLFDYKQFNPNAGVVYPNIINNIITNWYHQTRGVYDRQFGLAKRDSFCSIGWNSGEYAAHVHEKFLWWAGRRELEDFRFPPMILDDYQRVSINFICYSGEELRRHMDCISDDCEVALGVELPKRLGKPPVVLGDKIVVHFSYYTQQEYLLDKTNVLQGYAKLAKSWSMDRVSNAIGWLEKATPEELKNRDWLARIVASAGLYDDGRPLYGEWSGFRAPKYEPGVWQHPQEFADFLIWAGEFSPKSILDYGCGYGITTAYMAVYVRHFVPDVLVIGADNRDAVLDCVRDIFEFRQGDGSGSVSGQFDLAFVDGDHEYRSVKTDYLNVKDRCRAVAIHDIRCEEIERLSRGGNVKVWREICAETSPWQRWEFTRDDGSRTFGIGVVMRDKR